MKKSLLIALSLVLLACLIVGIWLTPIFKEINDDKKNNSNNNSNNTITYETYYFKDVKANNEDSKQFLDWFYYSHYGFSIKIDENKTSAIISNIKGVSSNYSLVEENNKINIISKNGVTNLFDADAEYLEFFNDSVLMTMSNETYSITATFIKDKSKIKQYDYQFSKQNLTENSSLDLPYKSLGSSFIELYDNNLILHLNCGNNYYISSMTKENSKYELTYLSNSLSDDISSELCDVLDNSYVIILENELQIIYEKDDTKFTISYNKIENKI